MRKIKFAWLLIKMLGMTENSVFLVGELAASVTTF